MSAADTSLPKGEMSSNSDALQEVSIPGRLQNVSNIANILIKSEKNPDNAIIFNLAQTFEQQVYNQSNNVADYYNRIKKRLTKLAQKVENLHRLQKEAPADPKYFSTSSFSGERRDGMDCSVSPSAKGGNTAAAAPLGRVNYGSAAPATNVWDAAPLEKGITHTVCPVTIPSTNNTTTQRPTLSNVDHIILSQTPIYSNGSDHGLRAEVDNLRIIYEKRLEQFLVCGKYLVSVGGQIRSQGNQPDRVVKFAQMMQMAERVLSYMSFCKEGHTPSQKSVDNLKVSLSLICNAHSNIEKKMGQLQQKQSHLRELSQQRCHVRELQQQPQDYGGRSSPPLDSCLKIKQLMINRRKPLVAHTRSSHPPPPLSQCAKAEPQFQHASDVNQDDFLDLEPLPLTGYAAFACDEIEIENYSMNPTSSDSKCPINMPVLDILASSPTSTSHNPPVDLNLNPSADFAAEKDVIESQRSNRPHEKKIHGYTGNERGKVKRHRDCTMDEADLCNASLEGSKQQQYASNAPGNQEPDIFPIEVENPFGLFEAASLPIKMEAISDKPVDKPFGMERSVSLSDTDLGLSVLGLDHTEDILNNIAVHGLPVGSEMVTLDRVSLPYDLWPCNSPSEDADHSCSTKTLSSSPTTTVSTSPTMETANGIQSQIVVLKNKLNELLEVLREDQELIDDSEIVLLQTEENMESCILRATYHDVFHVLIRVVCIKMDATGVFRLFPVDLSVLAFKEYKEDVTVGRFFHGEIEWPESKKEIYKKVSAYSLSVIQALFEESTMGPIEALKSFLRWARSYKKLFSDPCVASNKLLYTDIYLASPLPPFGRTHKGEAQFPVNKCSFVSSLTHTI